MFTAAAKAHVLWKLLTCAWESSKVSLYGADFLVWSRFLHAEHTSWYFANRPALSLQMWHSHIYSGVLCLLYECQPGLLYDANTNLPCGKVCF